MLLWDLKFADQGSSVAQLSEEQLKHLSISVIESTLMRFRPSFEALFLPETVDFVRNAVRQCRLLVDGAGLDGVDWDGFFDHLYGLVENDSAPGAASIVMALSYFVDGLLEENLNSETVLAVMSACYESILNSEKIPRITIVTEQENPNCVDVVEAQLRLVRAIVEGS